MKIKNVLGIPTETKFRDLKAILTKFRLLLFLFLFIIILYYVFFVLLKDWTFLRMGKDFAVSFSASLLEDIFFFLFIGFIATVVSIIISTTTPENLDFFRRASSIANSDEAEKNSLVKDFVAETLRKLTAFYREFSCKIVIKDFAEVENAYFLYLEREMILCNMCKDRDFENPEGEVCVEADIEINGTYGVFDHLYTYDTKANTVIQPPVIDRTENVLLVKGLNPKKLPHTIPRNSELGIKFGYNSWSKTGEIDDKSNWIYFRSARFSSKINMIIANKYKEGTTLLYDLKIISDEDNTVKIIASKGKLPYNSEVRPNCMHHRLKPGDKLVCYIYPIS